MPTIIAAGAAVRSRKTGLLGKVFRNPHGNPRGHIFVQWDGARDRCTERLANVDFVAQDYHAAKHWQQADAAGEVHRHG